MGEDKGEHGLIPFPPNKEKGMVMTILLHSRERDDRGDDDPDHFPSNNEEGYGHDHPPPFQIKHG